MSPFWKLFEQSGRTRGASAVLELAAFAALWPYISGGWTRLDPEYAPLIFALSLLGTLLLMIGLRAAVAGMTSTSSLVSSAVIPAAGAISDDTRIAISVAADAHVLPGRGELITRLDGHDTEAGAVALGIIRFANHAPMVAYDARGARQIMSLFVQRLKAATGRRITAMIGEDTFGVWFDEAPEEAAEQLKSLGYVLSQELSDRQLTVLPDIHIGLSRFPAEGHTARSFISHGISLVTPLKSFTAPSTMPGTPEEGPGYRFALEQALRRAVREGGLSLRYQPLIDTARGKVVGAEVLLRWRHPGFGDVSPGLFIPILERTGLIHEIGLWTLNSACRQLSVWRASGHPDIRLAINLSAVQLQDPGLKASITRVVASHGLAPSDVELELTETAAMENREATVQMFHDLRALGFGIALDDFGNGHSNFGYLRSLPFTKLKIDREFVNHVDTQPGSQAICKSLVELGAGLGITILAEGVERLEEVETLRRLGCHMFQGYYFERPQTAADFTARLGDADWLNDLSSDVHRSRTELKKRMLS